MIHSTAGGTMREYNRYNYAKVDVEGSIKFYLSPFKELKAGDIVLVEVGKAMKEGKVIRVDKNISEQNFPIPVKRLKKIIEILKG